MKLFTSTGSVDGPRLVAVGRRQVLRASGRWPKDPATGLLVAAMSRGSLSAILSERSGRRGSGAGLVFRIQGIDQAAVRPAPSRADLAADGFLMPRMYSTWAWSRWRVRSPIHSRCAEVSYQSPEVESIRVMASS